MSDKIPESIAKGVIRTVTNLKNCIAEGEHDVKRTRTELAAKETALAQAREELDEHVHFLDANFPGWRQL